MQALPPTVIAFAGTDLIAKGSPAEVATAAKAALDTGEQRALLIFDAETSRPVEIDFRGTVDDVLARIREAEAAVQQAAQSDSSEQTQSGPRGPGRPKLGVVAREVTLLPRHWEWLATQPGGASATLRRLVETARKSGSDADRTRAAQDATYRFALALAGNEPGFEEAMRALYAGDLEAFDARTESWPPDVGAHARELARGEHTPR